MSKKEKKNVSPQRKKQNGFLITMLVVMVGIVTFANVRGLANSYYDSFVLVGGEAAEAVSYLEGLADEGLSEPEAAELAALRNDWDSWRASRLRDEVTVTAEDGTVLHGYFYNENSNVTAIAVPRFGTDGMADFLLGPWLNEQTGCNILVIDPRAHGESGGECFSYGYLESRDLTAWMDWADGTLGKQTFLLWGDASGANTLLFAAASGGLEDRAALVVAESPFASLRDMADYTLKNSYKLPGFPFRNLLEGKLNRAGLGFRGEDMELGDALASAEYSVPVLCLISGQDTYVPCEMSEALSAAVTETIKGGGSHGSVYAACRTEVESLLKTWLTP